jgi:predicted Rossmann fold nucleotide-binding protein DprA/Smf involved in DNA uptake
MKYAIVGSRTLHDYETVAFELDSFFEGKVVDCINSGGADGIDSLAIDFARSHGIPFQVFEAQWDTYGPSAGPIRNKLIVEASDEIIAFIDSRTESKGTRNTIKQAQESGKVVHIYEI